jgi:predicted nucleic acid-binding protein
MSIFVLDTNVISDIVGPKPNTTVLANIAAHHQDTLCLCEAVDYEIRRGYLKTGAVAKLRLYEQGIMPQFQWVQVIEADWHQAAQFWADMVAQGKQLSDIDLLIASVSARLEGMVISADTDFDPLPITRSNWRIP